MLLLPFASKIFPLQLGQAFDTINNTGTTINVIESSNTDCNTSTERSGLITPCTDSKHVHLSMMP